MKDIPMFTSEYGTASLTLWEIPYRQTAYVRILATVQPLELAAECVSFCRACGAERIYITGHEALARYPLHTAVVQLRCGSACIRATDAVLRPILPEDKERWRTIYNDRMAAVPNAAYMTAAEAAALCRAGDGYFIYKEDRLLGIGKASCGRLDTVAAVVPGAGADCVAALCALTADGEILLEVATANEKAMALYRKMGFAQTRELSRWYRAFP